MSNHVCEHVHTVARLRERFQQYRHYTFWNETKNRTCSECHVIWPHVWICLFCDYVGCSRYSEGQHSLKHYEKTREEATTKHENYGHMLVCNPAEHIIWCYICDKEWRVVMKDDEDGQEEGHQSVHFVNTSQELSLLTLDYDEHLNTLFEEEYPHPYVSTTMTMNHHESSSTTTSSTSSLSTTIITKTRKKHHGIIGLKNLGNTCYMNAVLQALFNCEPLSYFFQECRAFIESTSRTTHTRRLADSYGTFIEMLWEGDGDYINPIHLVRDIKAILPYFRGYGQHDSQELLRCMLDKLHEELKSPSYVTQEEGEASQNMMIQEKIKKKKHFSSFISDLFEGTLKSRVQCAHCHRDSIKEDPFFDLSISISRNSGKQKRSMTEHATEQRIGIMGAVTHSITTLLGLGMIHGIKLQECLQNFCSEEELTGSDRYKCEHCNALHDCKKSMKLKHVPEIMCIHLKRFRHDSFFSNKIGTHVNFPLVDLDMRPYCCEEVRDSKHPIMYDLFAIINHRGGLHGGHYVTYAKNSIENTWYEFDDTFVTKKTEADISRVEAYVLFYRKHSTHRDTERDRILEEIKSCQNDGSSCLISRLWFNRWFFCSHPGPILNTVCLCEHFRVNTKRFPNYHELMIRIPESVYEE